MREARCDMQELRLLRQRLSDGADKSRLIMCQTQTNIEKARCAQARIRNERKKRLPVNVPALVAVVDDEPAVCSALMRLIHSCGYRVQSFLSGRELVRSLADHEPDCVVLDVHMAEMSGWAVQSHLRRVNPDIPLIRFPVTTIRVRMLARSMRVRRPISLSRLTATDS